MSKLVFKLKSVSKEEADGVRQALESVGVEFYETPGSSWGWSLPAIWVRHNDDFLAARQAIDTFQEAYVKKIRETTSTVGERSYVKIGLACVLSAIVIFIFNYVWIGRWF